MRAARIALLLAALVLVPATIADADVTIGSTLQNAPNFTIVCPNGGCTFAPTAVPGGIVAAPSAGVITRWRVRNGAIGTLGRLQVIHRDSPTTAVEVAHTAEVSIPADVTSTHATRIPIAAGDEIALMCCTNGGDMFANGSGTTDTWTTPLSTVPTAPNFSDPIELLVNADIEPDADTDGFGDETQDNCPGVANDAQGDRDHDGRGDACDVCPDTSGAQANGCPIPASPQPPPPNRPPTVRFRSPLAGAAIAASFQIVLDVADDRGSPTVTLFDDDGTICVLRAAPYACTWTPTGADVGRATLLASAVDAGGLSTLGIVRVRVNRFAATLPKPKATRLKRGRLRVTGRVALPSVVTRAQGCSGDVTVRVRRVRRTVALTPRCTYAAVLKVRTGRPRVTFGGNSVVAPT
jgi:Big-like domain-containing protein